MCGVCVCVCVSECVVCVHVCVYVCVSECVVCVCVCVCVYVNQSTCIPFCVFSVSTVYSTIR